MNLVTKFKTFLDEKLPKSHYSSGEEATCLIHRFACVLDPLDITHENKKNDK